MILATDLDSHATRIIACPTCGADLSIDADEADIGYLRCDRDETHLWRLATAVDMQT